VVSFIVEMLNRHPITQIYLNMISALKQKSHSLQTFTVLRPTKCAVGPRNVQAAVGGPLKVGRHRSARMIMRVRACWSVFYPLGLVFVLSSWVAIQLQRQALSSSCTPLPHPDTCPSNPSTQLRMVMPSLPAGELLSGWLPSCVLPLRV